MPDLREFSEAAESQLIANEVRSGKVKLVYKSFETATANGPDANMWSAQQSAAYAAGAQERPGTTSCSSIGDQGTEDTKLRQHRLSDRASPSRSRASSPQQVEYRSLQPRLRQPGRGREQGGGVALPSRAQAGTPALIATGPKSQTKPISGNYPYS